ncbi:MAG: GTPase Era [Clostridia bacterium]|nr:GTPase Era [Clostridia bacterium]
MRCGYVAVLGQPNAGKSSLVNFIVGEEVAVVSHRRQTTRNSILGIKTEKDFQIVFIDTPGIHHSENKLDRFMMKNVRSAVASADVILYLFDGTKPLLDEEREYIEMLKSKNENVFLVQTKADKTQIKFDLPATQVSTKTGLNIDKLIKEVVKKMPERPLIYDEELYTDKSVSFLVAEKIRGFLLNNIDEEIPHGVAIVVENFVELDDIVKIDVTIVCERDQHKGIVIGKGGSTLKKLGQETRKYVEELLQKKCVIKLFVKVDKDWRSKNTEKYGY